VIATIQPIDWVEDLAARRPEAVQRLHALLLDAAHFEVRRRAAGRPVREDLDDVAMQAADDALMAVLRKLHTFRGESRFTTWAYKFALLEAAVAMRKRAWQGREVVLAPEDWSRLESGADADPETRELLDRISVAIRNDLTAHQRAILLALAVDGVPIDVLAERLDTTRGALYKTLHDARRKLRACVEIEGPSS
jgi:RNA polymerase sigma-70 factor (ECF subfamily)